MQRKVKKQPPTEPLLLRVTPDMRRKLEQLAAKEDRSLAAQGRIVMDRGLEAITASAA